ncbi:MAG: hypothetical protein DWQ36_15145 [Acidobacteria bacterium]|nr:MAG: hypothetical protein DWQ30_07750 [Acidobacteriota bacterium]REK05845.1 MAG: hypothetical protein DWQ36_15145 [Acidobacteriota bacterium]
MPATTANETQSRRRTTTIAPTAPPILPILLTLLTLLVLLAAIPASAAEDLAAASSPTWAGLSAFGVSLFVGPPADEDVQILTGYDGGVIYTQTRGGVIEATAEAIELRRNGLYRVHVEGLLAFDPNDPTTTDSAQATFLLLIDGNQWVACPTPSRGSAPTVSQLQSFSPLHDRLASCSVDFTFRVSGNESSFDFPISIRRGAQLQVALDRNDQPLGESTLALTRVEVTRLGR